MTNIPGVAQSWYNSVSGSRYALPPPGGRKPVWRVSRAEEEEAVEDQITPIMQRELDRNIPDGLDLSGGENVEVEYQGKTYVLCSVCEGWTLKDRTKKRFGKFRVCSRGKCLERCDETLTRNAIAKNEDMPDCGFYPYESNGTFHCQACNKESKMFAAINGYSTCEEMTCKLYAINLPEYKDDKWKGIRPTTFNVVDCSRGVAKKRLGGGESLRARQAKARAHPSAPSKPRLSPSEYIAPGAPTPPGQPSVTTPAATAAPTPVAHRATAPEIPTAPVPIVPVPTAPPTPPPGDGFTGEARVAELKRLFAFAAEARMTATRFKRIIPIMQRKVQAGSAPFPQKSPLIFTAREFDEFVAFLEGLAIKNRAPPICAKRLRLTIPPERRPLDSHCVVAGEMSGMDKGEGTFQLSFLRNQNMWGMVHKGINYVLSRAEPIMPTPDARSVALHNLSSWNAVVVALSDASNGWNVHCVLTFRSFPVPETQHAKIGFVLGDGSVVPTDAPETCFVRTVQREIASYKAYKDILWSVRGDPECDMCHQSGGPGSLRGSSSVLACTQWVCKACKAAQANVPQKPQEELPKWVEDSKVDQFLPHRVLVTAPPPSTFTAGEGVLPPAGFPPVVFSPLALPVVHGAPVPDTSAGAGVKPGPVDSAPPWQGTSSPWDMSLEEPLSPPPFTPTPERLDEELHSTFPAEGVQVHVHEHDRTQRQIDGREFAEAREEYGHRKCSPEDSNGSEPDARYPSYGSHEGAGDNRSPDKNRWDSRERGHREPRARENGAERYAEAERGRGRGKNAEWDRKWERGRNANGRDGRATGRDFRDRDRDRRYGEGESRGRTRDGDKGSDKGSDSRVARDRSRSELDRYGKGRGRDGWNRWGKGRNQWEKSRVRSGNDDSRRPSPRRNRGDNNSARCSNCQCELAPWMRIDGRFAETVCAKEDCMTRYNNWRGIVMDAVPPSDTHFFVANDTMSLLLGTNEDAMVARDANVRQQNIYARDKVSFQLLFVDGKPAATNVRRIS